MGCAYLQGSFLEDLHRLHIPSLTWGAPPEVSGRPSRALRRIAGHTLSGLLAFGGCIPTIMGIMPVAKVDLLLLGAPPPYIKGHICPMRLCQTLTPPSPPIADAGFRMVLTLGLCAVRSPRAQHPVLRGLAVTKCMWHSIL